LHLIPASGADDSRRFWPGFDQLLESQAVAPDQNPQEFLVQFPKCHGTLTSARLNGVEPEAAAGAAAPT
jgi:hypothetical protein